MELHQSIRQDQRLIMNGAMERAFHVLMLPTIELSDWLEREIEKNPLLHLQKKEPSSFDQTELPSKTSLYTYVMEELGIHLNNEKERKIAHALAGSLDENGFLTLAKEELIGKEEVITKLHNIEPLGLGARSAQEALLIQLQRKKNNPIYKVISLYYDDLLHNRLGKISKALKMNTQEIKEIIQKELRPLNPFPGRAFQSEINPHLIADVTIQKEGGLWNIEVNDQDLPSFQIDPFYLDLLENQTLKNGELAYIRAKLADGKWLLRILERRKKNLHQVAMYLLKKQKSFLEGESDSPIPMTMKEMAEALHLSESTITRAISQKSIATPRGLLKLRSFFTWGIETAQGKVSNRHAKDLLLKLIEQEKEPLSDEALSCQLKALGISCARRTVAKYRKELKIASASQRKHWH